MMLSGSPFNTLYSNHLDIPQDLIISQNNYRHHHINKHLPENH